jgi:N-terminal acetyltransferase 2
LLEQRIPINRITGLATQLALAYAIHKSFIFIRVPLTAAITPKVVKILRGWGWDIGKRTTKEAKAIKRSLGSKPATK